MEHVPAGDEHGREKWNMLSENVNLRAGAAPRNDQLQCENVTQPGNRNASLSIETSIRYGVLHLLHFTSKISVFCKNLLAHPSFFPFHNEYRYPLQKSPKHPFRYVRIVLKLKRKGLHHD